MRAPSPAPSPDCTFATAISNSASLSSRDAAIQARSAAIPAVADSLPEAVVAVLVAQPFPAVDATGVKTVGGGGGVMANRRLRQRLAEEASARGVGLFEPAPELCTDNGAMIAVAGAQRLARGKTTDFGTDVSVSLSLGA